MELVIIESPWKANSADYYNDLLSSAEWTVIRDDDTLLIHEKSEIK